MAELLGGLAGGVGCLRTTADTDDSMEYCLESAEACRRGERWGWSREAVRCRYSGSDSVEYCRELTECCDGTDSSRGGAVPVEEKLLWVEPPCIIWLTDSENFSPRPLIWRVSAV